MPLFKGAPIVEYLVEMANTDPWQFLMDKMKEKKSRISYLEPCSVIVRLLDSNREVLLALLNVGILMKLGTFQRRL